MRPTTHGEGTASTRAERCAWARRAPIRACRSHMTVPMKARREPGSSSSARSRSCGSWSATAIRWATRRTHRSTGIPRRLEVPGPPLYRYYDWRPAPTLAPAWLFAGTGVTAATRIPGIVGYELDERAPGSPAGTQVLGGAAEVPCMPETEPSPIHGTSAESTLYTASSGALVFATGTLGWLYALSPVPEASPDVPIVPDARVEGMTRNVLARALAGPGG